MAVIADRSPPVALFTLAQRNKISAGDLDRTHVSAGTRKPRPEPPFDP